MRHSTGLSGGWAWALGAACSIVGCLNPMPDDFPSRQGHPEKGADEGAPGVAAPTPTAPADGTGQATGTFDPPSAPTAGTDDGLGGGDATTDGAADAGAPAASDGGAPADDGDL